MHMYIYIYIYIRMCVYKIQMLAQYQTTVINITLSNLKIFVVYGLHFPLTI